MQLAPDQFEKVCKVLADPQRFAIFERICQAEGEVVCRDIVPDFPVSQATISHHLKELMNAGLIDGRKEGQFLLLSAKRPAVEAYLRRLRHRLCPQAGARGN